MMSSYTRNFGSRPSCWCRWTYLLYSRRFSSRGVMGRNRKWVLEDSIQDAMWQTILRGPRPPSVRWEKQRNQSTAAHPANKKDSKIQPKCNRKPVCQKLCQPSRDQTVSLLQARAAAQAKVQRLQASICALGDVDMIEKENLERAIVRAQSQAATNGFHRAGKETVGCR